MGRHKAAFVGWALGALLLVLLSACADQSTNNGVGGGNPGSVTVLPTPTPTATPTLKPTVATIPKPTSAPVQPTKAPAPPPPAASVAFVNGPVTARPGQSANLIVRTSPNTMCTIEVDYKSGPSHAQGLTARPSDGSGIVSWSWIVGTRTTPGQWPIYVSCGSASNQTYINVT